MKKNNEVKANRNNIVLKALKIVTVICAITLSLWYTFDITGLRFKKIKIVTSALIDEPIDILFYCLLVGATACFILKNKFGKYLLTIYLFLWSAFQISVYLKKGEEVASYNRYFNDTHHIVPPSQDIIIKDTYHIVLDVLIITTFVISIIFLTATIINNRMKKHLNNNQTIKKR